MDYEKKYNEALERAKQFSEHPLQEDSANIVEYIFPELAESKDERIRKAIIEFFELQDDNTTYSFISKKDILAWLEKQKEFVSVDFDDVWDTADCDELTTPLDKYSKDAIKEMCHAWYDKGIELERKSWLARKSWLEKQGKQKPTDKIEALRTEYEKGRADVIAEMKSSWSEEDETNLTNTIIMLKEGASHHFTNFSIVPCVDWLYSLKQRIGG